MYNVELYMMGKHKVAIICPTYNEERFIEKCLMSIISQDYPKDSLEILFVDGRSTDKTKAIIQKYCGNKNNIRLLDNPHHTVPYALNIGICSSESDVVIRIDGHCIYPKNYVSTLVKHLYELNADNVGAVWNTIPAKDIPLCHSIAIGSSHPFGVGGSMHKIGTKEIIQTDTVPFGCYRREVFERIGLFDTDLTRNQDDEFNARLIRNRGKIYLIPQLVIDYVARDTMAKMRKMYYQYGLFKPLVNKKLGSPATIRQFFPLLFLLGIVVGGILSLIANMIMYAYIVIMTLYFTLGFIIGYKYAINRNKPTLVLLMPYVFLNIHLSYGYGYLAGICKILMGKKFNVESNR